MKRRQLKSKELNKLVAKYGVVLHKKDVCELIEGNNKIILVNKEPSFFYYNEEVLPTLHQLQKKINLLKHVTVDMGAVKFVVNGADVMRPGIVEIEDGIEKDDFIVIIDENNKKPLSVGIALLGSEEMRSEKEGKVIKNIHYVGDEIWKV